MQRPRETNYGDPTLVDAVALYQAAQKALQGSLIDEACQLCRQLISIEPAFADGYFLLAMSEIGAGRLQPAIHALEHAIHLAPRAEYFAHYAKCLLLVGRDNEALRAADRAAQMDPTDAVSLDTLANVYTRLGVHEKAVSLFQVAVSQRPDHLQMRFNLASSLGFAGRFDEAAGHYERVIAANPSFIGAHAALSRLRKQSVESNHIARLEALLPQVRASVDEFEIRHALAKEFEDLGDYESAFQHLHIANRQRKAEHGYHINRDCKIFDRLMQRFAQADYFRGASDITEAPIFVVGLPRTGTTLTDRIVSSHPAVESAGELPAMPMALKRLSCVPARSALEVEVIDAAAAMSPGQLGQLYLDLSAPHRRTSRRFIDKLPLNFFYLGFIARALPRATIVCLRRNPLDAVWSNYKYPFAKTAANYDYSYDLLDTAAYCLLFDRLMGFWQQLFPKRILELQYESIVEDLEGQARGLLAHCGLEWNEGCLRFHENESAVATPSGPQVRRPIYRSALGRWRAYERHLAPVREYFISQGIAV